MTYFSVQRTKMKISTHKVRSLLILLFISVMPFTHAQGETEYLGNIVFSGSSDDKKWGSFPIGFDFDFFGVTHNVFWVSSNGLVMFGAGSNAFSNVSIPDGSRPDNFIAPFWDDLIIHSSGDIMYQTIGAAPNRKLVIQFSNMSFWTSTVLLGTIQVILYEGSNNIQMQYNSIVDLSSDRASGNSATVGLENSDGTDGVLCSYNTAGYIYSGRAILFTPGGGTYTFDDNALFENIMLVDVIPRAGIPNLVSPSHNSIVGDTVTFLWEAASHASSYFVLISQNSDLSNPVHTSADLTTLSYEYTFPPDQSYYWSVIAKNSTGDESSSEIWSFQTSSLPPFLAVPQSIQLEQGDLQILALKYTGGDTGSKTATVNSLPAEGVLYQNAGGIPGAQIATVPTDVTDASFNVIYSASGAIGNGVGSFDFHFSDGTGTSTNETYTINVSAPGVPKFLSASNELDRVEITFDKDMSDPTGFHLEFAVEDNGVGLTSTSCALKAGDPKTIVVYVTPNLNISNAITVAYTRGTVTSASGGILESFDFQLADKMAQVIDFNVLSDKTYGDADFTLLATASSGLPITFSSSNTAVVSVSGSTATINNAGETLISAYQTGDATYAAVKVEQYQLVNNAVATVTLTDLVQEYTGSGIAVTSSTIPLGLSLNVTYDGLPVLPVDVGTYTVFAEVTEANYTGSATDLLTISDLSAPVPDLAILPDLTDDCSLTPVAPTATDFYAGSITGTTGTPFPITTQGVTLITWSYDDGFGNISTQDQTVTISDVTNPIIPTLPDVFEGCSAAVTAPTCTDACAGIITGTTSDPMNYSTVGIYVINWTFDDGNGNSISVPQNVIVVDVTDPVIPTLDNVIADCSTTVTAPTTTDNCAGTITATTSDPISFTSKGSYVINWTFDDGNGNSISVPQNVIVVDVTVPDIPTLADVTGDCSAIATPPTTTDACTGTITGTTSDPLSYSTQGTYVINWIFDDGNGNSISVPQNVIVADVTAPTATAPADVLSCDGTVSSIGLTNVNDNCTTPVATYELSGATTGNGSGSDASAVLFEPGVSTVSYTLDDGHGNSSQYVVTVTYEEVEQIVITVDAGTLSCENSGSYQWISCADNSIIAGETASSFSPAVNGEYAVILTQGGCSDTSACYTLDYTGIADDMYQDYKVYPNPAHEYVTIDMAREQTNVNIKIFDMTGNLLRMEALDRFTKVDLDLSEFKAGLYMIQILSDQMNSVERVIKE